MDDDEEVDEDSEKGVEVVGEEVKGLQHGVLVK
jgi:hypothetical protein